MRSLTPTDIEIVQSSFAKIAPIDDETGVRFYQRLFQIAPELRPLFPADMDEQARMFISMLTVAVNGFHDFDGIEPVLRDLAIRHVGYGVLPQHYASVEAALMWVLEQNLGAEFTPAVSGAWRRVYAALTDVMIEAGYGRETGSAV